MWHYHLTDADIPELFMRVVEARGNAKPVQLWLRRLDGSNWVIEPNHSIKCLCGRCDYDATLNINVVHPN